MYYLKYPIVARRVHRVASYVGRGSGGYEGTRRRRRRYSGSRPYFSGVVSRHYLGRFRSYGSLGLVLQGGRRSRDYATASRGYISGCTRYLGGSYLCQRVALYHDYYA